MFIGHDQQRGLIPRRCDLLQAGYAGLPPTLLASQCEGLDAVEGLRQIAHLHQSGTARPAAGDCFPLQGSHKLLMDHLLLRGHHSLPALARARPKRSVGAIVAPGHRQDKPVSSPLKRLFSSTLDIGAAEGYSPRAP